ncbi:hypothetical protein IE53DRAFT_101658 [Violaceomyces palustris]|uniref:Uncharacterized protein n=1 Tax=Violaceomyces palustris TaxID=1673888 RepID=A0ACD0NX03_9BASI|nr:hypothetical protein IE53DRAFT_101658 [Violaceomyces palustris]
MGQQVTKEQSSDHSHHHPNGNGGHSHIGSGHGRRSSNSANVALAAVAGASSSSSSATSAPPPLPPHLSDKVTVDKGTLVPQGVYSGPQDYNQLVVRQAIVDRRLAPFCKGSDDEETYADQDYNSECPICFLYYPSPLNFSRCCHQPICSECFVQMKRADPNHTNPPSSEPRSCPFCVEPNFGVTYSSPRFLASEAGKRDAAPSDATQAADFAEMAIGTGGVSASRDPGKKRVLSPDDPEVITVDHVRPDWKEKLAHAEAAIARRANRRVIMRQVGDRLIPIGISSSRAGADLAAAGAGVLDGRVTINGPGGSIILQDGQMWPGSGAGTTGNRRRGRGSRSEPANAAASELAQFLRMSGGEDMEEIMLMEAMRLSLLEHEEQQRKAAEEAKRKAEQEQAGTGISGSAATAAATATGSSTAGASSRDAGSATSQAPPAQAPPKRNPTQMMEPAVLGISANMISELSELIDGAPPPTRPAGLETNLVDEELSKITGTSATPRGPTTNATQSSDPVPVLEPVASASSSSRDSNPSGHQQGQSEPSSTKAPPAASPPRSSFSATQSTSGSSQPPNPNNPFRKVAGGPET